MDNKKARRLFILEWEKLNNLLGRVGKDVVEDDDMFLIFKRENIEIKDSVKNVLSTKLKDKVEVIDTIVLPDSCFIPFATAKLLKYCDSKTNLYFINCPNFASEIKDDIIKKVASVKCKNSINEVKHTEFINNEIEDNIDFSDLSDALADINDASVNIPKESKKNGSKNQEEIKSENKDVEQDTKKNYAQNNGAGNKKINNNPNEKNKSNNIPKPNQDVGGLGDIKAIEKRIFTDAKIEEQQNREYTELDDNKTRLLITVFERFKNHINLVIKNEEDMTDDDYDEIIILLIKTENKDDFNESKKIINLKAEMELDEKSFIIFKAEANYYIKMCNLFYQEDKW